MPPAQASGDWGLMAIRHLALIHALHNSRKAPPASACSEGWGGVRVTQTNADQAGEPDAVMLPLLEAPLGVREGGAQDVDGHVPAVRVH